MATAPPKLIRMPLERAVLLPEEQRILEQVHRAECAGEPTRVPDYKLEALARRRLIYVVRFPRPRLPRAHVTARGAVLLEVEIGDRR